jgi:hypothetical protein
MYVIVPYLDEPGEYCATHVLRWTVCPVREAGIRNAYFIRLARLIHPIKPEVFSVLLRPHVPRDPMDIPVLGQATFFE